MANLVSRMMKCHLGIQIHLAMPNFLTIELVKSLLVYSNYITNQIKIIYYKEDLLLNKKNKGIIFSKWKMNFLKIKVSLN